MKTLTRAVLATVALSFLAAPMANAQPRHDDRRPAQHHVQKKVVIQKKVVRHHWSKGQRYSNWKRHGEVRDYHRHGLKRPSHGQRWVKVDDQYLLITLATGLIAGIAVAR